LSYDSLYASAKCHLCAEKYQSCSVEKGKMYLLWCQVGVLFLEFRKRNMKRSLLSVLAYTLGTWWWISLPWSTIVSWTSNENLH
jgi:hypothetical protein